MNKNDLLVEKIEHIDICSFDSTKIIESMKKMSFTAREIANACEIYKKMLQDPDCTIVLVIAGSTGAAGCLKIYSDMVKNNMVDAIVATGASIIDMDFFEALGFRHYKGSPDVDDNLLRELHIDRIYDTFIDEDELQICDNTVKKVAGLIPPRVYSSREFIKELGRYLKEHAVKKDSLVETAYDYQVPIFCPAFSDCSAGFGLVMHQHECIKSGKPYISIDSVKDFYELTSLKIQSKKTGLFMIGGGVPKNFIQDTVVAANCLGYEVPMHEYAIQITVADVRDGACSSSTLKEASSWGKVDSRQTQMVYAEASSVLPLMISYLYHKGDWKSRTPKRFANFQIK
jgi:deoxyhypusine synthase